MIYVLPHVALRSWRTLHAMINAAKAHMPKWLAMLVNALMVICVVLPGPQDELAIFVIIGIVAAFKPQMRRDIVDTARMW